MLVVFGFLFFVMAGMKSPITVLYDFMQAVKYSYYIFAVISLLCRPIGRMAEGRYIGAVVSPYSFAMYLVVVIVVFLAEIDKEITENTAKTHLLLNGIGFISAVYFLWLTGSRNGELAAALCIFFYFMRIWILKTNVSYRKKIVRVACVMGILAVPSLWLQNWAVHNLAEKLGTVMYYPNDDRMLEYPGEQADSILQGLRIEIFPADIVYAAETADTGAQREMMKKSSSIELLSSGRTTIYKEYIANMNLFGHKKELRIWGEKMRAHNAVLQTGYRYGVFSMIPYVIMLLYVLIYSWRYMKQNWNKAGSYAVFPFLLAVSSEVMMMLDNVERNFRYVPWIAFYLLIGLLGQRKNP